MTVAVEGGEGHFSFRLLWIVSPPSSVKAVKWVTETRPGVRWVIATRLAVRLGRETSLTWRWGVETRPAVTICNNYYYNNIQCAYQ